MPSFALDLKVICDKMKERANSIAREAVADVARSLVRRSPVGDPSYWVNPPPPGYVGGLFRGNWQLGVNTIPDGILPRIDPTGEETLSELLAGIPVRVAGTIVYLANNLPYGPALENGWSRQAPAGVVEITTIEFQSYIDHAAAGAK